MTAICGGGASQRKPGVADQVLIGTSGIAALLSLLGKGKLSDIVQIAVAGTQLAANVFCANDPPADPVLTETDLTDAVDFANPIAQAAAGARIGQWFLSQYWYQICECDGIGTPAPPVVSNPAPPDTNTGMPPGAPAQCFNYNGTQTLTAPGGTLAVNDVTTSIFPATGPVTTRNESVSTITWNLLPVPVGIASTTWNAVYSAPQTTETHTALDIVWWPATGQPILKAALASATSNTPTIGTNVAVPSGAAFWSAGVVNTNGRADTYNFDLTMSAQCGGQTFAQPCCPPDPSIDLRFRQITEMLNQVLTSLPTPVNSWAESSAHSGLTGNGSFGISGNCLAIKVQLTSIPPAVGEDIGSPNFYFDAGWITFTTVEGSYSSTRVTFGQQVISVPLLGFQVDYEFHFGTVATVTELTRGP